MINYIIQILINLFAINNFVIFRMKIINNLLYIN